VPGQVKARDSLARFSHSPAAPVSSS
jgi:hypothetical protein